ncbi:MAG: DEAD/DEAH box helicase family protein [Lentisphaeraceae bacterium]|nr:DEAD/DEAH box helicase family protein [Lentisphaeraceae bacterium]
MKSLKQHLATLNYQQACEILGDNGETLLRQGGFAEIDISSQVSLGQHIFWLNLADASVTLTAGEKGLQSSCSECLFTCHHIGSALSVVLEEKEALGLAEVSPFSEDNHGGELIKRALNERLERSKKESMELVLLENEQGPWAHYRVFSQNSGKTYSLTIHGLQRGEAYCSCPDYKCNTLGTCKHLLFALNELRTRFSENQLSQAYERRHCAVHIVYGNEAELRVSLPDKNAPQELQRFANQAIFDVAALMKAVQSAMSRGFEINVYPDAAEYIDAQLYKQRMHGLVEEIQRQPQMHPLRKSLLKEPLLAYQLEGIAFAAGARRSIIADDMGLGKTIQGIGLAELLRQQAGISKVLVISPASLKNQWNSEIERFSSLTSCVVQGSPEERSELYGTAFFTICNYEQVLRDVPFIERKKWDLIILDEGQRIKNLESQTSKVVKSLKSDYALVLSGTQLENRLEDLFSVVNFVDARLLGPAFQFFEEYQECDNKGRLLAYKNLDQLRTKLKSVLLRRTRKQELPQLPALTIETRLIPPSEAQQSMDVANRRIMQSIITKSHISEMDLLRLR